MFDCPAFAVTLLHALWFGREPAPTDASLSATLMTYFGARFGVLGIYINGRYREARDRHRRAAALADPQHGEAVVKKK